MARRLAFVALAIGLGVSVPAAHAQTSDPAPLAPAPSPAPGATSFLVENMTRLEAWRFFEPPIGGGVAPDYWFIGSRSTLGASYDGRRFAMAGAIQYVRLENLPRGAIGPGLLGTGGAYYFQAVGSFSYQFYLRALSFSVKDVLPGVTFEAGRLSMAHRDPGATEPDVHALAAARVDGRLLGDMPWSFYQRAWDGARITARHGGWTTTVVGAQPTQGTFEESANLTLDRLRVVSADVIGAPGALLPHTAVQAFGIVYDDHRQVHARPDNSGVPATEAHVRIGTVGASLVGVYPRGRARWEGVAWAAAQGGDWYGLRHRAASAVLEGGWRWTEHWQPRLRAGVAYASGDRNGGDDTHTTFFQALPSGDQFVRSNVYALMNVVDGWVEGRVSPGTAWDVSLGAHHVALATAADRWYAGSGATERRGNFFGYFARNARGERTLGTVVEATLTWRPKTWWTLRGYAVRMAGGRAVRRVFATDTLVNAWLESTLHF